MALKVGERIISDEDLQEEEINLKEVYKERLEEKEYKQVEAGLRLLAKENLIQRVLLELISDEAVIEVPYEEIQTAYEEMIKHYGGLDKIKELFGPDRAEKNRLKAKIELSLKVDQYINDLVAGLDTISDDEVKAHYEHLLPEDEALENVPEFQKAREGIRKKLYLKKKNQMIKDHLEELKKRFPIREA